MPLTHNQQEHQGREKLRLTQVHFPTDGNIVRSLSGKNWQDHDKTDKVSISFPATPKENLSLPGGEKLLF